MGGTYTQEACTEKTTTLVDYIKRCGLYKTLAVAEERRDLLQELKQIKVEIEQEDAQRS